MHEGQSVTILGRVLLCKHCGHGRFTQRQAQLNTAFLEALDLGWLNRSAEVYVCSRCGFLHWFLDPQVSEVTEPPVQPQEEAPPEAPAGTTPCLACHAPVPAYADRCPACGWPSKREG